MHRKRNIYQSRTLDLLRNSLSDGQDGGCKQRSQTATIWLKALLMPRLAVCSRNLHWHWINWTLLCDTMEVSMLRLAWLPIAQHVFQPALTGRLELISQKIVSSEQEQRLSRWAVFVKNCLLRIECKELPRFREKYRALGRHVCKIREIGGQKLGYNMRPRYIQFRDINDRDKSGLHCIVDKIYLNLSYAQCLKSMVAHGDQKLGWTSIIWPWASKNYNRLYKEGNFLNISGRLRENFILKHCMRLEHTSKTAVVLPTSWHNTL